MTLEEAKSIADHPHGHSREAISMAWYRLREAHKYIGRHATTKAIEKCNERLDRLDAMQRYRQAVAS